MPARKAADPAPPSLDPRLSPFLSYLVPYAEDRDRVADLIEVMTDKLMDTCDYSSRRICRNMMLRRCETALAQHRSVPYMPLEWMWA